MKEVALITGAARNIGKGIARVLLDAGYACILVDVNGVALQQATSELDSDGHECYQYVADISSYDQLDNLLAWVKDQGLTITTLVNNAAYESSASVIESTPIEITKSFKTNLEGPFYLTSRIVKDWIDKNIHGNVVFISSVHSHIIRTHPLYSSSKAAIEMFIKEAAVELGEYKIRVNAIAPGPTRDTEGLKPDYRVPLGYYQQPQDIGEGVAFLVSGKARFITGQSLNIDGGYGITHTHHWLKKGKLQG